MLKRIVVGLLLVVGLLAVALALNTWRQGSRQLQVAPAPQLAVDANRVAESLGAAIRARTISDAADANANADQFAALHAHLTQRYPLVHLKLQREVVGGLSLLYSWPGSEASLPAIVLMAHQDVVPVAPGTEKDWAAEPFSGVVRDGFVWGRGSWDDKANLVTQLEAVEALLAANFQPRRSVYLVFGADEEIGGLRGALPIANVLKSRGVKAQFVVDEGLLITEGIMPGLAAPAALVGVAEKGYLSVGLSASSPPGHSSMPPTGAGKTAIGALAGVLTRLETGQRPAAIRGVAHDMFAAVAPEMGGFGRVALSNLWLFGPVVERQLTGAPSTNALLRTTTALTIVAAGNKDNVLPGRAEATVNFRLLPGETKADLLAHVQRAIGDAPVTAHAHGGGSEASTVTPHDGEPFKLVERTVRELFPGTVVAPGLMLGATDSRHFTELTDHVLRFSPVRAGPADLARFHGTNERIAVSNLAELVRFYHRLIEQGTEVKP